MTRQRILLIVLLAWALVMIVPDVLRVVQPLGSFGFYADNDGVIYDVTGPFDAESDSPAWRAGIRDGEPDSYRCGGQVRQRFAEVHVAQCMGARSAHRRLPCCAWKQTHRKLPGFMQHDSK